MQSNQQPTVPTQQQVSQRTMPMRRFAAATQPIRRVIPSPIPVQPAPPPLVRAQPRRKGIPGWLGLLGGLLLITSVLICGGLGFGLMALYGGGVLPGISAGGVDLGGLSEAEAANRLQNRWSTLTLVDNVYNTWEVNAAQLGISIDAAATAQRAFQYGRETGNFLNAIRGVQIEPVLNIDLNTFTQELEQLRPDIDVPMENAGVRLVNGVVEASPAVVGRMIDVPQTVENLRQNPAVVLTDGRLELVMLDVLPTITDASIMVGAAQALLANPLRVRVYDPVTGDIVHWDASPDVWARWLTANSSADSSIGLTLTVDPAQVRTFLTERINNALDSTRYIDLDKAVDGVQTAVQQNQTTTTIRVYHQNRQHTVRAGETIISIAWDYGVPYLYIQQANPGISTLSAGQIITIPPADTFLLFDPIPDKRIEVSISQQHVWVYENGSLKWDWIASTGINDSPTWPGVYQVISHYPNAYAANWDLWMPNFLGVYQPIPGQNFTNGFHGFPTRGGGQLLWENSLGVKVTYGCILLSNTNADLLYNWAQEGVVVEILP